MRRLSRPGILLTLIGAPIACIAAVVSVTATKPRGSSLVPRTAQSAQGLTVPGRSPIVLAQSSAAAPGKPKHALEATPKFDVASIKPTDPAVIRRSVLMPPDDNMLTISGMTLKALIQFSLGSGTGLHSSLISGGPSWFDHDRFDIVAKSEQLPIPSQNERRQMLNTLVLERFHLKYHHESKMTRVYALIVGKNGPTMKVRTLEDGGQPFSLLLSGFHLPGRNASMAEVANILQSLIPLTDPERDDRPVVDRTGLSGRFDFDLNWTPERVTRAAEGAPAELVPAKSPDLFTAIQDQLGLRLEMQSIPMEVLVIDNAERPSEN